MDQPLPEIIYEDQYLLVINKPAGLLSIRDGYDASLPFVRQLLEPHFGRLWNVHRLDRETSGVLLLARSPESHRILNAAFENHQVQKIYHAIVNGVPPWHEKLVDVPLKVNGDRRHRTTADPVNGKHARTHFHILQASAEYSLLEAHPLTGYTHQIRAHLFTLGFSILGDPLYSLNRSNPIPPVPAALPIQRLALHAFSIKFAHPFTKAPLKLVAAYLPDFASALEAFSLSM